MDEGLRQFGAYAVFDPSIPGEREMAESYVARQIPKDAQGTRWMRDIPWNAGPMLTIASKWYSRWSA
jgi:hypothetical protein